MMVDACEVTGGSVGVLLVIVEISSSFLVTMLAFSSFFANHCLWIPHSFVGHK